MAYTKQTWADLPSKTTPINAERLTHIEDGIFNAAQTADTAASTAGTAAANVGIVSSKVETLTERVNGLDTAVSNKVDKVAGKGLSTNDYDNTDKGKVDTLGTASTKNSTSAVTDSSDLVESGAVKDIVGWGNKNLLHNIVSGTRAVNGVTYTFYGDGTVKATGATGNTSSSIDISYVIVSFLESGVEYILSGTPAGSESGTNYAIYINKSPNIIDEGDGVTFRFDSVADRVVRLFVKANYTLPSSGIVFKPMIRLASVTDDTYEPYHPSVDESKADNSVIGTVEDGTNPTKSYAIGEHFIRNGKFCTVTVAVTTSSTWTLGSNYVEGDVASACKSVLNEINAASNLANLLPNNHQMCIAYLNQAVSTIFTNSEITMTGKIVACRNVNNIDWFGQFGTDKFAMGRISADGTYVSHTIIK